MRAETLRRLVVGYLVANAAFLTIAAYTPWPNVIDLQAYGAIGDGSTNNNAAFNAAFANAANGGKIHVPCGNYVLTQTPSVTLGGVAHVDFVGDGADCTFLTMTGAINGPSFSMSSQWSSVRVADMTIITNQAGGNSGLILTNSTVATDPARSASNSVSNVNFRGGDFFTGGSPTQYWATGLNDTNVSNLSVVNLSYIGTLANVGTGIAVKGNSAASTFAVQINIVNSNINHCGNGVSYGDWVQGVKIVNTDITGCVNGVVVVASPAGGLSGLMVANSQIAATSCGLCVNDTAFANAEFANNQLIIFSGAVGIKVQGSNFTVTGNEINSVTTGSGTGIQAASTINPVTSVGNGGIVSGNQIAGFGNAIQVLPASQVLLKIDSNLFSNNTNDWLINSSARGVEIDDSHPRAFVQAPPCNAAITASKFDVVDSQINTFNTTLTSSNTGGAGNNYVGMKCDGTRYYVD